MSTATAVRERPILFSGPMVRSILEGRKTQTRRVVKPQWQGLPLENPDYVRDALAKCPYGVPGDRLWVRETWRCHGGREYEYLQDPGHARFRADADAVEEISHKRDWKPSIHMPRWASRLTLEITGVRVEPLQAITDADCEAEGLTKRGHWWGPGPDWQGDGFDTTPRGAYVTLWDQLNERRGYGWDTNPWVWVIEFRRFDS